VQLSEEDRKRDLIAAMEGFPHLQEAARRRKAQLPERPRRRRLREGTEVVPVELETAEIDQLCDQLKEWLHQGQGERGDGLTFQEIVDHFREMLDIAMKEPPADEDTPEGVRAALYGSGFSGRGRRRDGMTTEQFRDELQRGYY
jgi:hypothetical protein